MNNYHVVVYFSDKINFETYIDSQLDIKEFTDEFSTKRHNGGGGVNDK